LLTKRRLVAGQCQSCGRQFFYRRTGRPRNFCDQKCRQSDFRHSGYLAPTIDKSAQKREVVSKTPGPDFGDQTSQLRVVAGPALGLDCSTVGAEAVIEANNRANADLFREHNAKAESTCVIKLALRRSIFSPAINSWLRQTLTWAHPAKSPTLIWSPDSNPRLAQMSDDLSIPAFLRRDSAASEAL
jgi:hypothetical protein